MCTHYNITNLVPNKHLLFRLFLILQEQKIFSVLGYFPIISLEMKNRGWVEKRDPDRPPINYSHYLKSARKYLNNIDDNINLSRIINFRILLSY